MIKSLVQCLLCVIAVVNGAKRAAVDIDAMIGPPGLGHPLIIKAFPAVEDIQSELYEVYMEPYTYDLHAASAVAMIQSEGENDISGEFVFVQRFPPAGVVMIHGNVTGLPAGKHGIHIHQAGDLRRGCEKLGGHFNPYLVQHGGPADSLRHVGDLGNIEAGEDGTAEINLIDPLMSLVGGPRGVVGRAIVISSEEDDLGRGGTADSITTGSTGKPLACGVIAYIK